MVFSARPKVSEQNELSVGEVYNLWDVLTGYYQSIEQLKTYRNYAHDPDLVRLVDDTIKDKEHRVQKVLEKMKKFGIKSPETPRKDVTSFIDTQVIHDEQICLYLLLIAQERVELKLRAVRNSTVNDEVRSFFIYLVKVDIENIDHIVKYMKIKGWIHQSPIFPNIPKDASELIDVGEAYHLWDHLVFRYQNITQTTIYSKMTHDGDFKLFLKKGLDILTDQRKFLEKGIKYFGLEFPKGPPEDTMPIQNTEILEDNFMYRNVLQGMESAILVHAQVLKKPQRTIESVNCLPAC
ncbi:MAG: DUF3231 family protein [Bacillota bacterium]